MTQKRWRPPVNTSTFYTVVMFKSLRLVEIMHSHERLLVIPIYFSVTWSVVCHIRLPCLNGSTDLDAILAGTLAGSSDHDPLRER